HQRTLPMQARYGKSYLAAAALAFVPLLPLVHRQLTAELTGTPRVVLAGLLALFAWLMIFGLFGTFLLMKRGCNSATRYLADASYWVYLVHFPFVGLAQIAIARLPILTPVKFLLAATITVALSLMTYHVCARYTWVGEFLNGSRRQRQTANRAGVSDLCSPPGPTVVFATTGAGPRGIAVCCRAEGGLDRAPLNPAAPRLPGSATRSEAMIRRSRRTCLDAQAAFRSATDSAGTSVRRISLLTSETKLST